MLNYRWLLVIAIIFLTSCNVKVKTSSSGLYLKKQRVKVAGGPSTRPNPELKKIHTPESAFSNKAATPQKAVCLKILSSQKVIYDLVGKTPNSQKATVQKSKKPSITPKGGFDGQLKHSFFRQSKLSTSSKQINLNAFTGGNFLRNFFRVLFYVFGIAVSFIVFNFTYGIGLNYTGQAALAGGILELLLLYGL